MTLELLDITPDAGLKIRGKHNGKFDCQFMMLSIRLIFDYDELGEFNSKDEAIEKSLLYIIKIAIKNKNNHSFDYIPENIVAEMKRIFEKITNRELII